MAGLIEMSAFERMKETIDNVRKMSASNFTIGSLLKRLAKYSDDRVICLSNERELSGQYYSYRGYYEDMALEFCEEGINTVGGVKDILIRAMEYGDMKGYKGGEFPITEDTYLWVAHKPSSCGLAILELLEVNGTLILVVKEEE